MTSWRWRQAARVIAPHEGLGRARRHPGIPTPYLSSLPKRDGSGATPGHHGHQVLSSLLPMGDYEWHRLPDLASLGQVIASQEGLGVVEEFDEFLAAEESSLPMKD